MQQFPIVRVKYNEILLNHHETANNLLGMNLY